MDGAGPQQPSGEPAQVEQPRLASADTWQQHAMTAAEEDSTTISSAMAEPSQASDGPVEAVDDAHADDIVAPEPAHHVSSNHSYGESFSRSRMSGGAALDTAALGDMLAGGEPDISWMASEDTSTEHPNLTTQATEPSSTAEVQHAPFTVESQHIDNDDIDAWGATEDAVDSMPVTHAAPPADTLAATAKPLTASQAVEDHDVDAWGSGPADDWIEQSTTDADRLEEAPGVVPVDIPAPSEIQADTLLHTAPEQPPPGPEPLQPQISHISPLPEPVLEQIPQSEVAAASDILVGAHTSTDETTSTESNVFAQPGPDHSEPLVATILPEPPVQTEVLATAPTDSDPFGADADDSWLGDSSLVTSAATVDADAEGDIDSSVIVTPAKGNGGGEEDAGPDFGDTSAFDDEWSKAVPSADASTNVFATETSSSIEEEWSKAFADEDDGVVTTAADDPWAALGDELDDGFLDDEPESATEPQPPPTKVNPYAPSAALPSPSIVPAVAPNASPSLAASYAPQSIQAQQSASKAAPPSAPMKFFEDLPSARPPPARRPKPQAPVSSPTPPPSAAVPPAASMPPMGPPASSSMGPPAGPARSISSQYGSFVPPPRQELFPPQPSVPPPAGLANLAAPPPPPSTSNRYSPAPVPSALPPQSTAKYAATPPVQGSTGNYPAGPGHQQQAASTSPYAPSTPAPATAPHHYAPATQASTNLPHSPPSATAPIAPPTKANTRYSPTPSASSQPSQTGAPPQQMRSPPRAYSPTSAAPGGPPPAHRFAPRTSSPLAYAHNAERSALPQQDVAATGVESENRVSSFSQTTPPSQPPHAPQNGPRRTKTSSPEVGRTKAVRPISAQLQTKTFATPFLPQQIAATGHTADLDDGNLVTPQDETAADPLRRWRGAPILQWGANGTIASTFPTQTPRYGGGQIAPMIKITPGEVKVRKTVDLIPELASLESFPGPLKSKGKKKEVVAWLSTYIESLQRDQSHSEIETMNPRVDERILLLQVLKVFVEHDGKLSGDPSVDLAVRQVLAPTSDTAGLSGGPSSSNPKGETVSHEAINELGQNLLRGDREKAVWHAVDHLMWAHALLISSTLNPSIWKQVVQEFVRVEVRTSREGNQPMSALYNVFAGNFDESIDELVPASARAGFQMMSSEGSAQQQNAIDGLNKWRETLGLILCNRSTDDEQGILALGKLLANYGRIEAAHICYLFAKSTAHFSGADDPQAHFTLLGADLSGTDKVYDLDSVVLTEIYEFTLSLATPPLPAYYIPHLQSYKLRHAYALAENGSRNKALQYCEAIGAATKSTTKLSLYYHPLLVSSVDDLAKRLAQIPKDGSSGWMARPSIEKVSGSMWARFNSFVAGDDGADGASTGSGPHSDGEFGPFGRVTGTPSISRTNSVTDLYGMPAAGVQAIPPNMNSRYAPAAAAPSQTGSPYAPNAAFQRNGQYNESRNFSEPVPGGQQNPQAHTGYRPSSQQSNYGPLSIPNSDVGSQPSHPSSFQDSYVPSIPEEPQTAIPHHDSPAGSTTGIPNPYAPSPSLSFSGSADHGDEPQTNGFVPKPNGFPQRSTSYGPPPPEQSGEDPQQSSYDPSAGYQPSSTYDPQSNGGYDPSAGGSYDPPQSTSGYQPYQPEPDSPVSTRPKKGIMEDDDDTYTTSSSSGPTKAEKDRAADEAFKRAAEEDAKRDAAAKEAKAKGGWFGGWLGAKKDPNMPVVHKAKLGEENSFVFDPETKKWVNKKAGATGPSTPAAAATPPPPRAGPPMSRNITPSGPPMGMSTPGPPQGPPSRIGTPGSLGLGNAPPSDTGVPPSLQHVAGLAPPGGSGPPSLGPPSRPPTSMSNASSIDDLLGAPAPRKGGTVKKGKKGGRYVDVMAK
ncbi:hypothetical protein FH972_024883 [Carpinus fangiana]|uniref:Protein transport protein sec16 n=1 Tax=Carpinus fangiana TaxID=176857 RepID=A0A5N6KZS8_9ROSI|nr:hypothetical protein FH972_024883 [Carpinus fangiana]